MKNFPTKKDEAANIVAALGEAGTFVAKLISNVLEGPSELSKGERELIALYVSSLNDCAFCIKSHGAIAVALGESEDFVEYILDNEISSLPGKYQPLFAYAGILTENAHGSHPDHVQAILDQGWSEDTALDVLSISSVFAMMNRLMSGSGTPALPDKMNEAHANGVAKNGYLK